MAVTTQTLALTENSLGRQTAPGLPHAHPAAMGTHQNRTGH